MPVPVVAATPAELAEARRLSEIFRQLDDPARRRAEERWQLEHKKRMDGYQLQMDLLNAESEKLRKEQEQRLVVAADWSDVGMSVWILFISIAVALLLVAGSAIATRRTAKGTAQR
jgi:hypothetical protein